MRKIGIYLIVSPTHRKYVGQTIDFDRRKRDYITRSGTGQVLLEASLKKYGYENHSITLLEECDKELLNEKEVFYIDLLGTYFPDNKSTGLNLTRGGEGKRNGKTIYQYDKKTGKFIQEWKGIEAIREYLSIKDAGAIFRNIEGKLKSCYGYLWRDVYTEAVIVPIYRTKKIIEKKERFKKPVYAYQRVSAKLVHSFVSIEEAARQLKIDPTGISGSANKRYLVYKDFKWSFGALTKEEELLLKSHTYSNIKQKIIASNKEGDIVDSYESINAAAKNLNINAGSISANLSGKTKFCNNLKFSYQA